jgi:hypothetical protein
VWKRESEKRGAAMTINVDALLEHFEEEAHKQQELSAFLKAQRQIKKAKNIERYIL